MIETATVTVALSVLAALVYGSYVSIGGFVTDPWMVQGWYEFAPQHGLFELSKLYIEYNGIGMVRSLDFIRLAAQSEALGFDMTAWLAWQVAMCVIMSIGLFVLLRELRMPAMHAAAVAALVLIFPAATSIRIWPIMGSPAAITLAALGFVVALRAFERGGWQRAALHACSVGLYVASAFLYESLVPLMFLAGLLYRVRLPWRDLWRRWAVDVLTLSAVAAVLRSEASVRGQQDLAGTLDHARTMADQALTLFASVVLPLGGLDRWLVLILAAAVPVAALVVLRRRSTNADAAQLRFWLWALVGGVLVVALGYAAYVAGDDYYQPLAPGIGNRVNAVPAIGFALILYALAMLVAIVSLRRSRHAAVLTPIVAISVCAIVSVSWLQSISRDEDAFLLAHREGDRVIGAIETAVPDPRPGSTVWAFGQPMEVVPGVPIFDQFGSLASRVRLTYGDPTLDGLLGTPGTWFQCGSRAIVPHGTFYDSATGPAALLNTSAYGRTYFVDTTTGRGELIRTPRACLKVAATLPQPAYLPGEPAPPTPPPEPPVPAGGGAGRARAASPGNGDMAFAVRDGAVTGYVDYVAAESGLVYLSGWATRGDMSGPAELAVAVIRGRKAAQASVVGKRPDVVRVFDKPALGQSGFVLALRTSALDCDAAAEGLTVFGVSDGVATRLPFAEGSEEQLMEAC